MPENDRTDCEDCSICALPFTEGGEHKAVSIKCGHVFGESCIRRWFTEFKKRTCPICKERWKLNQIRPLFGYKVRAAVPGEIDNLQRQLDEKKTICQRLEKEKRAAELQLENVIEERKRLKASLDAAKNEIFHFKNLQGRSSGTLEVHVERLFSLMRCALIPAKGCSCFAMTPNLGCVFVDREQKIMKQVNLSTCQVEWMADFQEARSGAVWDIKISPDGSQVCLAIGENLCIRSLQRESHVQKLHVGNYTVLCCAWHNSGQKVYAGLGNGSVMEFDVRNPATQDCVSVLRCPQEFGVQSLISGQDHLYGCTRQSLFRWDAADECSTICAVPGSIESLAHDSLNNCMSASIRPSKPQGKAIHEVWNLSNSSIQKINTLSGHKSYHTTTKGCFVVFQGLPPMFASGDEEDNSLCLWNIKSNLIFRKIKCYEPIIQIHSQLVHGQPYLAALSASGLSVFTCP